MPSTQADTACLAQALDLICNALPAAVSYICTPVRSNHELHQVSTT